MSAVARARDIGASIGGCIQQIAEKRLPALTRLKLAEALPIVLNRRRIYVVPTRFGLVFSALLIVMLLGALNYNNNPALLLTCLLAAASYQSVFQGFRCVDRVELASLQAQACHAGGVVRVAMHFRSDGRIRRGLRLRSNDIEIVFDICAGDDNLVWLTLAAPRRGWQPIGRIRLWSEYPFGLFHIWSWLHPDFTALIYPRVEANAPALPRGDGNAHDQAARRSGDEFAMLRDYHPSDPRRTIAWKASARHDSLLVKEFEQRRGHEIALDWQSTATLEYEARIERMAAWVCAAEAANIHYSLVVPGERIGPSLGADHRHACLRALALMPQAGA